MCLLKTYAYHINCVCDENLKINDIQERIKFILEICILERLINHIFMIYRQ